MDLLILWFGFIGSWLLFAGPLYQAALELKEQDLEREHLGQVKKSIPEPKGVSVYWWFLPPVKLYLEHQQSREYREAFLRELAPEVVEQLIAFISKATGWAMVSFGGFCIAVKETYGLLHDGYDLSDALFWATVLAMAYLSISYTVISVRRARAIKAKANN